MPSSRNFSQKGSVVISSPLVVYLSNWLEQTQEVKNLLLNVGKNLPSSVGVESDKNADKWVYEILGISLPEFRVIQAFFHLFMRDLPHPFKLTDEQKRFNNPKKPFEYTGDPNWEMDCESMQDVQIIEKAVLASLFLDKNQIPVKLRYIYDLTHRIPIERFNRSYTLPDHWEIPLPDQTREVSSLGLEEGTATFKDLRTLRTRSYYHIQKDVLMERVRHLLSNGLFNGEQPRNMEQIDEMYEKLLDYRGAIMWETASNQFPEDEVVFLWNRSLTSQSIERAWHLPLAPVEVDDSIPNFTVTHHGMVKNGDRLIPTVDTEVWTSDQLRDVLGHDWMYDPILTLEDNWMDGGRDVDYYIVRRIATFADQVWTILPVDNNYQGGFLIETDSDYTFLESRENLLKRMNDPNYVDSVDSTESLREDSGSQPMNLQKIENEYCFYNGSNLKGFYLNQG